MRRRLGFTPFLGVLCVLALVTGSTLASQASDGNGDSRTSAKPLRTTWTMPFANGQHLAWVDPAQCDADGNVFLIPVPEADPRDLARMPEPPRYTKKPSDILRVSADGKETAVIKPADVPAFSDADAVTTSTLGLGSGGVLHAVVRVDRGEQASQYIVSFDSRGRYSSHLEVDPNDTVIGRLETFGSGEFFIRGTRLGVGPRAVVMEPGSARFHEVAGLEGLNEEGKLPGAVPGSRDQDMRAVPPSASGPLARGSDGRIYFVPQGKQSVHVIEASGESRLAFNLSRMASSERLVGLKVAGDRLMAAYVNLHPATATGSAWMAVYDTTLGKLRGVYGPVNAIPVCYRVTGDQEEFTLLRGANLVKMSP